MRQVQLNCHEGSGRETGNGTLTLLDIVIVAKLYVFDHHI
jgi:hypothetical protein